MIKLISFFLLVLFSIASFIFVLLLFQKNSDWILNLRGDKSKVSYNDDIGYLNVPDVVVNLPGSDDRFCKAGFTLAVNKTGFESLKGNNYRHFLKASITEVISSYRYKKLLSFENAHPALEEAKRRIEELDN